jgi:hypothetical protein
MTSSLFSRQKNLYQTQLAIKIPEMMEELMITEKGIYSNLDYPSDPAQH